MLVPSHFAALSILAVGQGLLIYLVLGFILCVGRSSLHGSGRGFDVMTLPDVDLHFGACVTPLFIRGRHNNVLSSKIDL